MGASKTASYTRPENRLCTTKSTSNSTICKRCGNGAQGIPYWDDKGILVEVEDSNGNLLATTSIY